METLLIKDESGIYHLTRNERPLLCPMQTRLLVPVPKSSSLMTGSPQNQMELQERSTGCNSMCALFKIHKKSHIDEIYDVDLCNEQAYFGIECTDISPPKQPENVILMPKS